MRNARFILLFLSLLLPSFSLLAQKGKPDYLTIKKLIISGVFERADSLLRPYDFRYDQSKQNGEGEGCTSTVTWRRQYPSSAGRSSYSEVIALYKKCEGAIWYSALWYLTVDEEWFNRMKGVVKEQKGVKSLSEAIKADCMVARYRDTTYIIQFTYCSEGRKEYYLDLIYDFPF